MPARITFDITKTHLEEIIKNKDLNSDKNPNLDIKINVPIIITLESLEEFEALAKFIRENKKLEYLKINLPGSFNFLELFTEELIREQVPNLKITIQEKIDNITTTTFNEFS